MTNLIVKKNKKDKDGFVIDLCTLALGNSSNFLSHKMYYLKHLKSIYLPST